MKRFLTRLLVLSVFCLSATLLLAQTKVEFELKSMSLGPYDGMTTTVNGADEKLAQSIWRDLMKQYGGKVKRSKPEKFKVEGMFIDGIGGADGLNVYAMFEEQGEAVKTTVWISERGDFISGASADRDVERFSALMTEYGQILCVESIQQDLNVEQKSLDKVEKELTQLERAHKGYLDDIERAKKAIEQAEKRIIENEKDQEKTRTELEQATDDVGCRMSDVGCRMSEKIDCFTARPLRR